ncbi:craniofacial development protein 2-like [Plakobranchus ocellatus]|uniref:Craniofacial development protein 2-like n=1 Tax=Plakobranchus ocellatus TaxID=259542 RepID=A0AAV3YEM5_9GAST|nr:craniofacial development protein 2-like [Plakobranchus ocellatus]
MKSKRTPKIQDTIIVMGDFNAKVEDERPEDVVGPSGIGTVNERGSRVIEWCQINDFTITNTWYQNHPRRQWTWKSPRDSIRNKMDYILIQKRFRNAVKTSKSLPGADRESEHIPAFDKVRHVELFRMLEKLDIDGKDLRVIRNLYWDQSASVRIEGEHSDFKPIKRGVGQGRVMSPDLFNLYSEIISRNLDGILGLKINRDNLNNLR